MQFNSISQKIALFSLVITIIIAVSSGTWLLATRSSDKIIEQKEERIKFLTDRLKACEDRSSTKEEDITRLEGQISLLGSFSLRLGVTIWIDNNNISITLANAYEQNVELRINDGKYILYRGDTATVHASGKKYNIILSKYTTVGQNIQDVEVTVHSQK